MNRSGIARLNADGSLDLTFSPDPIFPSEGGSINALVTQPDQKVLIGTFHGTYRLKADGSLDTSFGGVAGYTSFLASQPDGKLLAGWWWGLKRFNADGSLDPGFDALGLWGGLSSLSCGISVIALQTNGKILVGGQEGGLVRLNPDGGLDASFDLAAGLCSTLEVGGVTSLGIQTDGQLIVAGRFLDTCLDDFAYLVRLNDGELPMILPRSIRRSPTGEFEFRATGPTNQTWIIQVAHTLAAPNWTAVATNTLGIESLTFTDPGAANIPSRFYRATLSQ
jgi:uncharacterized delta-60 repeat protein